MNLDAILSAFPQLLAGLPTTLLLVGVAVTCGFLIAVPVALMRLSANPLPRGLAFGYVYVFRSTPLLVQIFLIYYGSGQFRHFFQGIGLWTLFRDAWFCALLALALNNGAYAAEIIRGGIMSVQKGMVEAGRAVGMSGLQVFRRITFPLALRQALPAYGNEVILMVKASSLASTITILEVTGIAKKIIASTFRPVEVFIVAGALYLLVNFVITRVIVYLERRLDPQHRRRKEGALLERRGAATQAGIEVKPRA